VCTLLRSVISVRFISSSIFVYLDLGSCVSRANSKGSVLPSFQFMFVTRLHFIYSLPSVESVIIAMATSLEAQIKVWHVILVITVSKLSLISE
jgi:hypothetical protein